MATFISNSPAETEAMARRFAEDLVAGSILALKGELGSGKTLFTQGLLVGLGSNASVTSPTFIILHEYQGGRLPVYHFDFFRLDNRQSAVRLGLEEYLFADGICVIEWAADDGDSGLASGLHVRPELCPVDGERRECEARLHGAAGAGRATERAEARGG